MDAKQFLALFELGKTGEKVDKDSWDMDYIIENVMDLVDENRIFVREGLARLEHTENAGLAALIPTLGGLTACALIAAAARIMGI